MSTQPDDKKLEAKTAWLFAAAAVVAGIGVTFGLKSQSWTVLDAVYTVLFAGLGFASTYLTSAKTVGVWGRFSAAGGVFAVFTIWFVKGALASNEKIGMIPTAPPFDAIIRALFKAGATPVAIMFGVFMFLFMSFAGLAGAFVGSRLRAGKGYGLIPARR
jgi:hypothetical protein